jgi:glutamate/aspartate transport system substrate-binding protein
MQHRITTIVLSFAVALSTGLGASAAQASTMLERIKAGQPLVIAHRDASIPFSYVDKTTGKPVGYAVDLCHLFAEALRKKAGVKTLEIKYLSVTSANRIDAIEKGTADIECGSTSNTADRRKRVAFVIPHFITGARLLARADSKMETVEDFEGRKVVSTKGSTPLKALHRLNSERLLRLNILEAPEHVKGVEMVEKGEADAFAMDDVLLFGLAAARPNPAALRVTGKFLTTEAIAVMLAHDDLESKKVLDDEMRRLIFGGQMNTLYEKWFMKSIPSVSVPLNMPMSYLLRAFWKFPTDFVPD